MRKIYEATASSQLARSSVFFGIAVCVPINQRRYDILINEI